MRGSQEGNVLTTKQPESVRAAICGLRKHMLHRDLGTLACVAFTEMRDRQRRSGSATNDRRQAAKMLASLALAPG